MKSIKTNFATEVFYEQMDTKLTRWILPVLMLITETAVHAQTHPAEAKNSVDSISTYPIDSLPKKRSFFGKILFKNSI